MHYFYSFLIKLLVQAMKESYRQEQKRRIKELSSALKDPSVIILSSWLKVEDNVAFKCSHKWPARVTTTTVKSC